MGWCSKQLSHLGGAPVSSLWKSYRHTFEYNMSTIFNLYILSILTELIVFFYGVALYTCQTNMSTNFHIFIWIIVVTLERNFGLQMKASIMLLWTFFYCWREWFLSKANSWYGSVMFYFLTSVSHVKKYVLLFIEKSQQEILFFKNLFLNIGFTGGEVSKIISHSTDIH